MKLILRSISVLLGLTVVSAAQAYDLAALGSISGMPELKASYDLKLAAAKVADTCPTSRPGSVRAGNWGSIAQSQGIWGSWQWINAGERHFVKMVGTARPGTADLYVKRNGNPNTWERFPLQQAPPQS
jgi:hypothetical protein